MSVAFSVCCWRHWANYLPTGCCRDAHELRLSPKTQHRQTCIGTQCPGPQHIPRTSSSPVPLALQELYKAQSDSGLLSEAADEAAAKVADQRLQVQREKQQQARAVQAHSLMVHAALDKTPPAKSIVRRMHIINQPRRFN